MIESESYKKSCLDVIKTKTIAQTKLSLQPMNVKHGPISSMWPHKKYIGNDTVMHKSFYPSKD